ncbi:LysR family transcriptional regulator [Pigmentiphaga sp. NML030171]|uniref:LysR family transcriptional regulator n=1 Tax=Pigmentiphaga sp. NML030171 TaxID=2008676 RepID=UPI001595E284|nr:LysR family transcriptional regulator [Pigmentiphaga sp. NML030171]
MKFGELQNADFTSLHFFVLAAQAGSLSRGALSAGVSQPTFSRHVLKLEREMHARLFERVGRGVTLTAAGRRLYEAVLPGFEQLLNGRRLAMAEVEDAGLRQVTMGLPPSIANILGPRLLSTVRTTLPTLRMHVVEGFHRALVDSLHRGHLDFALLYTMIPIAGLHADPLMDEELCLVMTPARARNKKSVSFSQLGDFPLSLPSRPHGLRELLEDQAAVHRVRLDVRHEFDTSLTLTKQMPMTDLACTVLPFSGVHDEVETGRLAALPIRKPDLSRRLVIAYANNRSMTTGLWQFLRMLRTQCEALVADGVWKGARIVMPGA